MDKVAIIKTGGKQYLVKENEEIIVDFLNKEKGEKIKLDLLGVFNEDGSLIEIGQPLLKSQVIAEVVDNLKGDKIKIRRFKAKVRYRKTKGFRPKLTKLKIVKI